jgi:alpha-glucosidase (family GH31 glycosyl hydrolase)
LFTTNNNNNYNNNYKQKPSMKISENNEEIKITYNNHKKSNINSNNINNDYKNFYNNQEYFNDEIIKNNDIFLKIQYCQS